MSYCQSVPNIDHHPRRLPDIGSADLNTINRQALERLPGDLSSVYKRIVHRLRETLKPPAFDLCSNVLMWVVSATVGQASQLTSKY